MKQMLIVIKETYLRHVKSWSFVFMVLSPFLFLGLSLGIGYLQGSSMASSKKVAVLPQLDSVREVLRDEDQLSFQYKDEAAAKQAVKDKKIAGYLTVEEKDGQLSATYYAETSMNAATKMALSNSLIQVQQALNLAQADLSDEQSQILARTVQFEEKKRGATIIFSDHVMTNVEELCDDVLMIRDGQVVLNGEVQAVRNQYGKTRLFVSSDLSQAELEALPHVVKVMQTKQGIWKLILDDETTGPELFDRLTQGSYVATFDQQAPTIDEIFKLESGVEV